MGFQTRKPFILCLSNVPCFMCMVPTTEILISLKHLSEMPKTRNYLGPSPNKSRPIQTVCKYRLLEENEHSNLKSPCLAIFVYHVIVFASSQLYFFLKLISLKTLKSSKMYLQRSSLPQPKEENLCCQQVQARRTSSFLSHL